MTTDTRRHAPAAERNRRPILDVLRPRLPGRGTVIEIASGSGEHVVHFAQNLPGLTWQPSDRDPDMLTSIEAWRQQSGSRFGAVPNIRPPLKIDVGEADWPAGTLAAAKFPVALIAINLLHVASWSVAETLFSGAGDLLVPGRMLYLYGPYHVGGKTTSHGNATFDRTLRQENAAWGVRDLEAVQALGEANRLELEEVVEMPAANLSLIFRKI